MDGVRLSLEDLLAQFPISRRLAARVLALLKEGLLLSAGVLDLATPKSALEKLLLSRPFLEAVRQKSWGKVKEMVETFEEDCLILQDREGGEKLLLLEDEAIASEVEQELQLVPLQNAPSLPAPHSLQLSRRETAHLFSPEQLSQLKVELFTSSNPDVRIESLRKLALSPLSQQEKEKLLLSVLYDKHADVRREALEAMVLIGLNRELLPVLQQLLGEETERAREATTSLLRTPPAGGELDRLVLLGSLLRALELHESLELQTGVLEFLAQWPDPPLLDAESVWNIGRKLLALRQEGNFQMLEKIRKAVTALARQSPHLLIQQLSEQVQSLPVCEERTLYLRILCDVEEDGGRRWYDLILTEELEQYYHQKIPTFWFLDVLASEWEVSFSHLLETLPKLEKRALLLALELTEELLAFQKGKTKHHKDFFQKVIQVLPTSLLAVVGWILRSPTMAKAHKLIPQKLREKLVRELLYHLDVGQLEEFRRSVLEFVVQQGVAAVRPLLQYLLDRAVPERLRREGGESLLRALGQLSPQKKTHCRLFEQVARSLIHHYREKDPPLYHGHLALLLGRLAVLPMATEEFVQKVYDSLMANLGKRPHGLQILTALAHLSSSDLLGEQERAELTKLFLHLFGRSWRGHGAMVSLERGEIFFYEDVLSHLHSDLLPHLLEGLKNLALKRQGPDRYLIFQTLIVKWKKIQAFEEVWTPFNTEHLLKVLEKLGREVEEEDMVKTILEVLLSHLEEREDYVVIPSIAAILASHSPEKLGDFASSFAKLLVKFAREMDLSGDIELSIEKIYRAIAVLLAHKYYSLTSPQGSSLFNILVKGLREGREGSREALLLLRQESRDPKVAQKARQLLEGEA